MNYTPVQIAATVFAILLAITFMIGFNAFVKTVVWNIQMRDGEYAGNVCVRNCGHHHRRRQNGHFQVILPQVNRRGENQI